MLLGLFLPPLFWLTQFNLNYALLPWACAHGHRLVLLLVHLVALVGSAWAGGVAWRGAVGWEARHDRIDPVGLYHTVARQRIETVRQDIVRETSAGVFAEAQAQFTSWLRAVAGLRYDHYFFDVISDNPANSGRDDAGRISPKVSAIFGPWAKTELFSNFGLGFHSNDARGVTTTIDPKSGRPVSKAPPLVGTRGAEVGVRTEVLPGVQSSLALWRLDLDSELVFTGDAGTTEPSRASRRQGVEWSTRWRPIRWLLFDLDLDAPIDSYPALSADGGLIIGARNGVLTFVG